MTADVVAVEALDTHEAERLTQRIVLRLGTIADNYEAVMPMIREAIERHADAALGYASPGAYISERFGDALSRIGVDMRRDVVRELTEAGMSSRAIAPVVGVSHVTVQNDIRSTGKDLPVERPVTVTSLDGRERPATQPQYVDRTSGEVQPGPRERAYAPRTDVVLTINSALTRARDAAHFADQIKREHLSNRSEEAATWGRSLSESIQSLQRLMDRLTEAQK